MRYYTIPQEPNAVLWQAENSNSGVIRVTDVEAWAAYEAWCAAGNTPAVIGAEPVPSLEEARTRAHARVNIAADAALAPILSQYPLAEVASWDAQLAEAEAWLAEPTTRTPLIDAIAGHDDKAVLCHSIIAKASAYKHAAGSVIGWRRAVMQWIEQCEHAEVLTAYVAQFPKVPA